MKFQPLLELPLGEGVRAHPLVQNGVRIYETLNTMPAPQLQKRQGEKEVGLQQRSRILATPAVIRGAVQDNIYGMISEYLFGRYTVYIVGGNKVKVIGNTKGIGTASLQENNIVPCLRQVAKQATPEETGPPGYQDRPGSAVYCG